MSEILGIAQSDLLIKDAVEAGLTDLRNDPDLLDYCFASMRFDDLTKDEYGAKQVALAKAWFLATNVVVSMSVKADESRFPIITISLMESAEVENTHGDVHYVPFEDVGSGWPILVGPFNPIAYAPSSGMIVVPVDAIGDKTLGVGMSIYDRVGNAYEIIEILDDDTIAITPGIVADFGQATIKSPPPRQVAAVESANFRETYQVGVHVTGESDHLMWLHSIVSFALLRYREIFLESRGLERTTISSLDLQLNSAFETERVFSRGINVTGYVRQYWPKRIVSKIETVTVGPIVVSPAPSDDTSPVVVNTDASWVPRTQ